MSSEKMREEFEAWITAETALDKRVIRIVRERDWYAGRDKHFLNTSWSAWKASRAAVWQPIDTCPQHQDVLFFRPDAGVFTGMITDADHFMSDKDRDEWEGTEEEMFELDAFGYGDWGACRCDGSERPTHWMPLPAEPEVKP